MYRMFGLRTSIAATIFLSAAAIWALTPNKAYAQVGLNDVGATQSINNELSGAVSRKRPGQPERPDAQEVQDAPANQTPSDPAEAFARNAQSIELSVPRLLKLVGLFLLLWMWVKVGDWVNEDSQLFKLGWYKWNPIVFVPFTLLALILFFVPLGTEFRAAILLVVFLATWLPYVLVHNKNVQPHQTVLTGAWWRFAFASLANKLGMKVSAVRKAEYEKGAPVELMAMGADNGNADNANLLSARNSPGYLLLKDLVAEMVDRRIEKTMLDFTKQAVSVRHEIDGMWHNGEAREREASDVMLAVMKTLSNLDVKDRRNKQKGQFGATYKENSFLFPMVTQGVSSGERIVVCRQGGKQQLETYAEIGMRDELQEKWEKLMGAEQGLVVLSTMPGGGLTTITDVSIEETDRLMRDFVAIEDENHRDREIQNLSVTTYDSSKGETPVTVLPKLIRTYPNVYVVRDLVDVETAKLLFNEIRDEHLVVTTVRAREAAEALLRLLHMKLPVKEFAAVVNGVLYQRLIRLLCADCKVGYTPPAEVLRKLGIPAGKVEKLYRPPKPDEIEKPCQRCQGLGYRDRTGVFELLVVTDQIREIISKQPKLELLKKAARASRQRSLQEEGILLVAKGDTSLPELMRVLKQ